MKKLIFSTICALSSVNVSAGNWVEILDDKDEKITINTSDIRRTSYEGNSLIGIAVNQELKRPKIYEEISQTPLKSLRYLKWHDCKNRLMSEETNYFYYDVNGSILGSGNRKISDISFNPVIPDTLGDVIQSVGCIAAMTEEIKMAKTESEISSIVENYLFYAQLMFANEDKAPRK